MKYHRFKCVGGRLLIYETCIKYSLGESLLSHAKKGCDRVMTCEVRAFLCKTPQ